MRYGMLSLIAAGGLAVAAMPGQAAPLSAPGIEAPSGYTDVSDRRCGYGRHWVSGHYHASGYWTRGHCARDRHVRHYDRRYYGPRYGYYEPRYDYGPRYGYYVDPYGRYYYR